MGVARIWGLAVLLPLAASALGADSWSAGAAPPPEWRLIEEIQRYPLLGESAPDWEAACAHPDWMVREATAWAIRRAPNAKLLSCVERLLEAPEVEVRGAALGALVAIDAPETGELLLRTLTSPDYSSRHPAFRDVGSWLMSVGLPDYAERLEFEDRLEWAGQLRKAGWKLKRSLPVNLDRPYAYVKRSTVEAGGEVAGVLHLPARPRKRAVLFLRDRAAVEWDHVNRQIGRSQIQTTVRPEVATGDVRVEAGPGEEARAGFRIEVSDKGYYPVHPGVYRIQASPTWQGFFFLRVHRSEQAERKIKAMLRRGRRAKPEALKWLAEQRVEAAYPVFVDMYRRTPSEHAWHAANRGLGRLGNPEAIPLLIEDSQRFFWDVVVDSREVLTSNLYPEYLPYAESIIQGWRERPVDEWYPTLSMSMRLVGRDASPETLDAVEEMADWVISDPQGKNGSVVVEQAAFMLAKERPEKAFAIASRTIGLGAHAFRDLPEAEASPWVERLTEVARGESDVAKRLREHISSARLGHAPQAYWANPVALDDPSEYKYLASVIGDRSRIESYREYRDTVVDYARAHPSSDLLYTVARSACRQGDAATCLWAAELAEAMLGDQPLPGSMPYSSQNPFLPELRGEALADLGRPDEALKEFRRAHALASAGGPSSDADYHFGMLEAYAASVPRVEGLEVRRLAGAQITRHPDHGLHRWDGRGLMTSRRSEDAPVERYAIFPSRPKIWTPVGDDRMAAWFETEQALALYQLGEDDRVWTAPLESDGRGRCYLQSSGGVLTALAADRTVRFLDLGNGAELGRSEGGAKPCRGRRKPPLGEHDIVLHESSGLARYALANGQLLWRAAEGAGCDRWDANSNTVLCLVNEGVLRAFDREDGSKLWEREIAAEEGESSWRISFLVVAGRFGANSFAVAGGDRLVAFDTRTGETAWTWTWQAATAPSFDTSQIHLRALHHVLPFESGVYVATAWDGKYAPDSDRVDVALLGHDGKPFFHVTGPWVKGYHAGSLQRAFVREGRLYLDRYRYEVWSHPAALP